MDNPTNSAPDTDLAKIQEMTGINEGSSENLEDVPETPEAKPEEKPEVKAEEVKPEEAPKEKEEGEDEKEQVRSERPNRSDRPLKAVFTQIKELRDAQKQILDRLNATPAEKKDASEVLDEVVRDIADRRNLDAEGLKEILEAAEKRVMKNLEDKGLLKKDLTPDILEKLKLLDTIEAKQKEEAEKLHDQQEWLAFLPELQKQFPNASAKEFVDAQKLMDELAHTKEFHDKELDYVLYKNRDKFAAILKVAKGTKAGETSTREIGEEDTGEKKELDLDPENITPEKMKRFQDEMVHSNDDGIIRIS